MSGDAERLAARLQLRDQVKPADVATVRRLVADTGFFRDDEVDVAAELVQERLQRGAASGYEFLFGEHRGDVIGYTCFGLIGCTLHSWDLYWIATDRHWQGRGVGRRLLEETEARVAALGGRRLYVETSSLTRYDATRRFYEALGYRLEAVLEDFYAPGDGKAVYVKELVAPAAPADHPKSSAPESSGGRNRDHR